MPTVFFWSFVPSATLRDKTVNETNKPYWKKTLLIQDNFFYERITIINIKQHNINNCTLIMVIIGTTNFGDLRNVQKNNQM